MDAVEIKARTDDTLTVGGWGVVFGGVDLTGETFTPETDFMPDLAPTKLVMYDHALGEVKHVLGRATVTLSERGLWVESQLDRHANYMAEVEKLLEAGALGWSSGSVGHLVEKQAGKITRWPIVEFSLTPTPAEPRTLGVHELRSLAELDPAVKAILPKEPAQGAGLASETVVADEATKHTEDTMSELNIEELTVKIADAVMAKLAAQTPEKTGGFKTVGEAAESLEGTKSFGDYLLSVRNRDIKRLRDVYEVKDLAESAGSTGGYLVPEQFVNTLLEVMGETAIVRPRAYKQPMAGRSVRIPVLNQTTAPTAGDPAWFGGVHFHWTEEGGAKTETEPTFKEIELVAHELAGYTQASNTLMADSSQGIDALLRRLFGAALAWQEDYWFLRGNGVGKPLGILSAPALLTESRAGATSVSFDDLAQMIGKFLPSSFGRGVWLMHPTVLPKLVQITDAGSNAIWVPNVAGPVPGTVFGMPVIFTEKVPALGTEGDVLLADLGYYVIGDRQNMSIDFSEHYAFINNVGTWRISERIDGQPWIDDAITLTDASTQLSPFVALS